MNYVLLSQKSHVEFFLAHMLSLGVTLIEFVNEVTKKVYECLLVFFDR
jgi:hypothetical protein